MRIEVIPVNKLDQISFMVPYDVYEDLSGKRAVALGAFADEGDKNLPEGILGVIVYRDSPYSDILGYTEVFLAALFVEEEFRGQGIGSFLLDGLHNILEKAGKVQGISVNLVFPEQKRVSDFFSRRGYEHRIDGNKIYKIPREKIVRDPGLLKLTRACKKCRISSFSDTSNHVLNSLYSKFGDGIPDYLSPDTYGGILQKDLSFVVTEGDEPVAFLASSLYPGKELFLGGIFSSKNDGITVAALIGALVASLSYKGDIDTVLFSAATEAGERIVQSALKNVKSIENYQVVSNYFKLF